MLGKEFLKCRRRAGKLIPVFGDPEDAGLQETAGDLLLLYRDAAERRVSRGELAEPVEALIRGRGEPAGAFAKLLARTADFTEPGKFNTPALLTSLGKRAIADLEDLVAGLTDFYSEISPESYAGVNYFISRLALIRDQLVEKLAEVRNSAE